jgi:hypothetical protein
MDTARLGRVSVMAEASLDHAGEVTWYPNERPLPVVGPCPHGDCEHRIGSVIAWGPDYEHYCLVRCDDECAGTCRTWTVEYPPPFTPERPKYRERGYLHVQPDTDPPTVQPPMQPEPNR